MKKIIALAFMALFLMPLTHSAAQEVRVTGISHSDFVEDVLPYMRRPAVILFGSNYCGYSRQQLKILRTTLSDNRYLLKYIDFYSVNVDSQEDSDWFDSIYDDDDDERGTPTWVFYYLDEDGQPEYYYNTGNMTSSDMVHFFERLSHESYYLKDN